MKLGYVLTVSALLGPGVTLAQQADDEVLPFPILMATCGDSTADLARGIRYAAVSTDRTRVEVGLAYRFGPDLPESAGSLRDTLMKPIRSLSSPGERPVLWKKSARLSKSPLPIRHVGEGA